MATVEQEAPPKVRCTATKANGDQCGAWAIRGRDICAGHAGVGVVLDPVGYQAQSAASRRAVREHRRRSAADHLADALERNAETLVSAAVSQAETDWRAVAWMFDRVYGKPTERVEVAGGLDLVGMTVGERQALAASALSDPAVIELLPEQYRTRARELAAGSGGEPIASE